MQYHKHQTPPRRKTPIHFHSFTNLTAYFPNINFIYTLCRHFCQFTIIHFHKSVYTKILLAFPSHVWSKLVCVAVSATKYLLFTQLHSKQYPQPSLFLGPDISLKASFSTPNVICALSFHNDTTHMSNICFDLHVYFENCTVHTQYPTS